MMRFIDCKLLITASLFLIYIIFADWVGQVDYEASRVIKIGQALYHIVGTSFGVYMTIQIYKNIEKNFSDLEKEYKELINNLKK